MFTSFIRGVFIVAGSIFLFKKLMAITTPSKFYIFSDIFISILTGLFMCFTERYIPILRIAGLAIVITVYMRFCYNQPRSTAVTVTVIALGFSILFFIIAGILVNLLSSIIILLTPHLEYVLSYSPALRIAAGVIQLLIASIPFKFDRLKNGMPFLQSVTFDEPCLLVGVLLIAGTMFIRTENDTSYIVGAILAFGMLLFSFWHFRLIQTYLLRREKEKNAALEQERRQLEAEADAAAYAASKERHKVKRLTAAVQSVNGAGPDNNDQDIIQTHIDAVDLILQYAAHNAEAEGVNFTFTTVGRVKGLFDGILSEDELSTLIGDLLDNALNAVRYTDTKNVRLHIATMNGAPVVSVMDSGIDFEPDTIRRLGKECATTHPGDGGSGLGLMSVFDTLRRHDASFEIDETIRLREKLYTKAVLLCFDGLGQTRIKTNRPDILAMREHRPDIYFVSSSTLSHNREEI